ncbi:MAG TPA: CHASE2 domain-containing protein [Bryobacteraceae bacterium]|nr:CHASE2 domain-containing protein [Bryobacteraceae bacterium]
MKVIVRRDRLEYLGLLAAALVLALALSGTQLFRQIDKDAYDWMFRKYRPPDWDPQSILLAIDEESFRRFGGVARLRSAVAEGLERIAHVAPKAVAVDVVLADPGDPRDNARLEAAMRRTPNLVLGSLLVGGNWEDPLTAFSRAASARGHFYTDDVVCREIPLEKAAGHQRLWTLALQAYSTTAGKPVIESQYDLQVGDTVIPAPPAPDRMLRIRYRPPDRPVPQVTLAQLESDPGLASRFAGKTVFLGVTAQNAFDSKQTPYALPAPMPGVEIHANVFETIANRQFLVSAPPAAALAFCLLLVTAVGTAFAYGSGWWAYSGGVATLLIAAATPYVCFTRSTVLEFSAPVLSAGFAMAGAFSYRHFVVRRRMMTAEVDKSRYQQAMHFVTHEMRTPLTAIQGSSELIGRYAMTEEKRKQMAQLINSESKRLGKMIEIFLSVERLSAGQLELKKERFAGMELMSACVERVRPLAERKQIAIHVEPGADTGLLGDRELMEYAFYNLLTNAVKYSPASTNVTVYSRRDGDRVRIAVQDQGIGMDQKEVRKIFQKFYRTKKAEESGEVGTGIGLSIVEQIITQHGGSIEVTSSPGHGSCFTLVLPVQKIGSMVESN